MLLDIWNDKNSFSPPICKLNWDTIGVMSPDPSEVTEILKFKIQNKNQRLDKTFLFSTIC